MSAGGRGRPGTWVPLDAHYLERDDVLDLSRDAELLWLRLFALCMRTAGDGTFTMRQAEAGCAVKRLPIDKALAELVALALVTETDDGYRLADWDDWVKPARSLEAQRRAASERKARQRARKSQDVPATVTGTVTGRPRDVTPPEVEGTDVRGTSYLEQSLEAVASAPAEADETAARDPHTNGHRAAPPTSHERGDNLDGLIDDWCHRMRNTHGLIGETIERGEQLLRAAAADGLPLELIRAAGDAGLRFASIRAVEVSLANARRSA